jgi:hypothetical protein
MTLLLQFLDGFGNFVDRRGQCLNVLALERRDKSLGQFLLAKIDNRASTLNLAAFAESRRDPVMHAGVGLFCARFQ